MLRVDCYDFYKLGHILHPIIEITEGGQLMAVWPSLFFARAEIDTFFRTFPLKTARAPASQLYQAILALVPEELNELVLKDDAGEPRILSYSEVFGITTAAKELEAVLKAELSGWDIYFVSQKGAFSTTDLVNRAELLLPEATQQYLSAEAQEDLRQCGRCLAFNLSTAAAFHIVRCTETFIWKYYEAVVGALPSLKMRNWGAYVSNLKKCPKANTKVVGWLSHIKDEYRNPVMHPSENVLPDDALMFINACISLMSTIAAELRKIEQTVINPALESGLDTR